MATLNARRLSDLLTGRSEKLCVSSPPASHKAAGEGNKRGELNRLIRKLCQSIQTQ